MSEFEVKKKVNNTPKEQECAGWCGEVLPVTDMKEYRKKLYCASCLEIKQNEVKKTPKPAGLTEDAIKSLITSEAARIVAVRCEEWQKTLYYLTEHVTQLEKESPNNQLRDLVVAAKTIMGHFVSLDRFTKQNTKQGNDMRNWIAQAEKILEGKS